MSVAVLTLVLAGCGNMFDPEEISRERGKTTDGNGERYCAELKKKIAATREGSDEYKRLMAQYKEKCGKDEKEDDGDYCENLAKKIRASKKDSKEYKELMALYEKKCKKDEKNERLEAYCEELAKKIRATRKGTADYRKLMAEYEEKCKGNDVELNGGVSETGIEE